MAREIIDSVEKLEAELDRVRAAQREFATYTQEQVDKIFFAAAMAANKARIPLAKMAVEETGMGLVEDKIIKNHYAAEYIYNAYKNTKTCGVIEEDKAYGIKKIAEPLGVIAAVCAVALAAVTPVCAPPVVARIPSGLPVPLPVKNASSSAAPMRRANSRAI